jgi:hypothetical protein
MVHHNFRKGQRILIILNDGSQIVDKYHSSKGHYLILENNVISWSDIRSSTIYKQKGEIL